MKKILTISLVLLGAVFSTSNIRAEGQHSSQQHNETMQMKHSSESGHHHGTMTISDGQPVS